jgi:hypothetical protein
METNANHIHKSPGQGWKHYLFEFLMVFLGVLGGFLAENIREGRVERENEKQYMKSLWKDLKADVETLGDISIKLENSNKEIDKLIRLLKSSDRNDFTCKIYGLAITIPLADKLPQPQNKTFEQLKSSGNLRLVRNSKLLDQIGAYYKTYDQMMAAGPGQMLFQNRHDLYLVTHELFDMKIFEKWIQKQDICIEKPVLLSNDPVVINKVCARYFYMQLTRKTIAESWIGTHFLPDANSLLKNIQKEYDFKD